MNRWHSVAMARRRALVPALALASCGGSGPAGAPADAGPRDAAAAHAAAVDGSPVRLDELKLDAGVGYALVGVGSVAAATGLVWLIQARPGTAPARRLTITPGGGGLFVAGDC